MRTESPPNISLNTRARRRARITPDLKNVLEVEYQKNSNPKKVDKIRIAKELSMSTNSVHFWFQNRRAEESKKKKKLQDIDYNKQQQQNRHQYHHQQQQPIPFSKTQTQLPSIATMLGYNSNLYLPNEISMVDFYFHHHHYGIGPCFMKWQSSSNIHYD
ncbi:unnamed protein product [Cunninghamella blakesleeana]